jgi:hypothetical protein
VTGQRHDQARLSDLLLKRAFGPRAPQLQLSDLALGGRSLSRREFLAAGSAGFVTAATSGAVDPQRPRVVRRGHQLIVLFGRRSWIIDASLFGSTASVAVRELRDAFLLRLARARLPGTDLDVSFRALLFEQRREWQIRFEIPALQFVGRSALAAWIDDGELTASAVLPTFRAGGTLISSRGPVRLTVRPALGLSIQTDGNLISVDGPVAAATGTLRLDIQRPSTADCVRHALNGSGNVPATRCIVMQPAVRRSVLALGRQVSGRVLHCSVDDPVGYSGDVYSAKGGHAGVWLIEGPARLHTRESLPDADDPGQVRFEHAAVLLTSGSAPHERVVAGRVSRRRHPFQAGGCQFLLSGDDERPFYARFRDGHAGAVTFQARAEKMWLPVGGADVAEIDLPARPVHVAFEGHDAAVPDADRRDLIVFGPDPALALSRVSLTDRTALTLKRGFDLLNLTFQFHGFHLEVRRGEAFLCRDTDAVKPTLAVVFPPQHVGETWNDKIGLKACEQPPKPVLSWLSSPSRIVFDLSADTSGLWNTRRLTVASLTEWSDLALAVNCRALDRDATPDEQLALISPPIDTQTHAKDLVERIAKSLHPPRPQDTALVLADRLILSPPKTGRFRAPRHALDRRAAPLWHTRLDRGRDSVRAIWSQWMHDGIFQLSACGGDESNFALSPSDHWDIVGQTSVYGLPALRRIEDQAPTASPNPVDNALRDLPRSRVFRPEIDYQALKDLDGSRGPETGFALPQPFNEADLLLTSIGGTLVADWHGEPPNLQRPPGLDPQHTPQGFSVERLAYRSQLGRDIKVEVVRKGYTLPHGQRCSFVVLTERRFFTHDADADSQGPYPTAYLFRRRFLVFARPEKLFPGVNQPFESRDFPANRVVMLTRESPDLLEPKSGAATRVSFNVGTAASTANVYDGGAIEFLDDDGTVHDAGTEPVRTDACGAKTGGSAPLIFWPRVPGDSNTAHDVEFKWTVDEDATPITSPVLFVENAALVVEDTIRRVASYYRSLTDRRTAQLSATRRRYGPRRDDCETSFDTDSWLMSVRGRLLPPVDPSASSASVESFVMDGRMEGADQPPFYPFVENAFVHMQTLDRLLGEPQGQIRVAFDPCYVRYGLDPAHNLSEIYLDVLDPIIALDVTNRGDAVGGLAKPSASLAALSCKVGFVGGTPTGTTASAPIDRIDPLCTMPAAQAVKALATPPSPIVFDQARLGSFNPEEFFGKFDAKIFGLFKLSDLIKATGIDRAPRLLERVGYGVAGKPLEQAASELAKYFGETAQKLRTGLHPAVNLIEPDTSAARTLKALYPDLCSAVLRFDDALGAAIGNVSDGQKLLESAATVALAGKALVAQIDQTLHDPVPAIIQARLGDLARGWNDLKAAVSGNYLVVGRRIYRDAVETPLRNFCQQLESKGLAQDLFGVDSTVDCAYVAHNPSDVLTQIDGTLFARTFGKPVLDAVSQLLDYAEAAGGAFTWPQEVFRGDVRTALVTAISDVKSELATDAPILLEDVQAAIIAAIVAPVAAAINAVALPPVGTSDTATFLEVRRALQRVDDAANDLGPLIDQAVSAIDAQVKPASPNGPNPTEQLKQAVVAKVRARPQALIAAKTKQLRAVIDARIADARADAIQQVVTAANTLIDAFLAALPLAEVVHIAQDAAGTLSGWCQAAAGQAVGVVAAADRLGGALIRDTAVLSASLTTIDTTVKSLTLPTATPVGVQHRFEAARALVRTALASAVVHVNKIDESRLALRGLLTASTVCDNPAVLLAPIRDLFQRRASAVDDIRDITIPAATLAVILESVAEDTSALDPVVSACRDLWSGVTSIAAIAESSAAWQAVDADLARLRTAAATVTQYADDIQTERDAIVDLAAALQNDLAAATIKTLPTLADRIGAYATAHDRQLAAFVLQTVALTQDLATTLESTVSSTLGGAATILLPLYQNVSSTLGVLVKALDTDVVRLIVNPDVAARFKNAKTAVDTEAKALSDVAAASTPAETIAKARALRDLWAHPAQTALVVALSALADLIEHVLRGDLGSLVNTTQLRDAVSQIEGQLQAFVAGLVPTHTRLQYSWSTRLGEPNTFFEMVSPQDNDLTLTTTVDVDLSPTITSGALPARSVTMSGTLQPFRIKLFGNPDIVTIVFERAAFLSQNGASHFEAPIRTVILGPALKFLEPLRQWLSPKNGIYIRPLVNPPGITAGFGFATDIISLGALSFLNVALDVHADLPFSSASAVFSFSFASPEREFLISAPPYGGGGYLQISYQNDRLAFSFSLMFGGVVAIKFGPLSAQGRLLAGVYTTEKPNGERVMGALVEAAGEGHIACFGIAVCLTVGLEYNTTTGTLTGFSDFSFEFKIGFVSFGFSIRANYTLRSGQKSGPPVDSVARAFGGAPVVASIGGGLPEGLDIQKPENLAGGPVYRSAVPQKATEWDQYRNLIDLDLLHDRS